MVDVCQNLSDEQLRLDDTRHLGDQLELMMLLRTKLRSGEIP